MGSVVRLVCFWYRVYLDDSSLFSVMFVQYLHTFIDAQIDSVDAFLIYYKKNIYRN